MDHESAETIGVARAVLFAWSALALVNAVIIAATIPWPASGWGTRLYHHGYDAGHMLAAGTVSALVAKGCVRRLNNKSWLLWLMLTIVSIAFVAVTARTDLLGVAGSLTRYGPFEIWRTLLVLCVAAVVPLAVVSGRVARRIWRPIGIVVGIVIAGLNNLILVSHYRGLHVIVLWASAVIMAASLYGWRPAWSWLLKPKSSRGRMGSLAALVLLAGASVIVRPKEVVVSELFKIQGNPVAMFRMGYTAELEDWPQMRGVTVTVPEEWRPWFSKRDTVADIPPSERLVEEDVVVWLVVIDCLRADLLDDAYAEKLPTLHRLKKESVWFSEARAPAPSTNFTMSAVFTGKYPTQLDWQLRKHPQKTKHWPHKDPSPRVPDLLDRRGIRTVNINAYWGLWAEYGVTAGFRVEPLKGKPGGVQRAMKLVRRDMAAHPGPTFFYTHHGEPHAPYNLGGKKGTAFERYVREVAIVDAQLGTMLTWLERRGLTDKTLVIVTADHGEAFGEHGTKQHARTVYDEAVHVPLMFWGAKLKPRVVRQPVSLIDLAPTFLDLYGLPTPGPMMGQTLVPLLRGEDVELQRPIVFDSMGQQIGMLFPDNLKVIAHPGRGARELYNLSRDPKEIDNIYSDFRDASRRMMQLRAFYEVHGMRPPAEYGY